MRDINPVPAKAHRFDDASEQLTGSAHERFTACILIRARCFTDEHQFRIRITDSENGLGPAAREVRTVRAYADAIANLPERRGFGRNIGTVLVARRLQQSVKRRTRNAERFLLGLTNFLQRFENERKRGLKHGLMMSSLRARSNPLMMKK